MAKPQAFSAFLVALFFCFLLIASNETQVAEAKVCGRMSQTWTGFCGSTGNCDRQCKAREDARSGSCHHRGLGFACFCYFNC